MIAVPPPSFTHRLMILVSCALAGFFIAAAIIFAPLI